ncbi:MAG: flagellar hook assembly protein FlgD [Armatimonadetes bacterium]|nr:flagellar hook assembly protein FlgD [Armatimonadota bacterium]
MHIQPALNPGGSNASPQVNSGSIPGLPEADLGRQEFLQLLVTQLRTQDPLSPMEDRDFIAQMAQLSSLDAIHELTAQMDRMLQMQQSSQAVSWVGRTIQYLNPAGEETVGEVQGVRLGPGEPRLLVDGYEVPLAGVIAVL